MSNPPVRTPDTWIDEGPVSRSTRPIKRSRTTGRSQRGGRKEVRPLDTVIEEFEKRLGTREASKVIKRYEAALQAFEANRYPDARKILAPLAKDHPDLFAVREMLGLCLYRAGQWKPALGHLEAALALNPSWIFNHPVIADCHRALGNHVEVKRYWQELSDASPHAELLAEGRIVLAGSLADQGLLEQALDLMSKASAEVKKPSEYHLRQWFVVADLHDRMGNTVAARRFFERVAAHDPGFVDVAERLATLGS